VPPLSAAGATPAPGPSLRPRLARSGPRAAFATDLVLVHAPSIFDFRTKSLLQGPFADVVPSTGQFEMYPVGLTSIAAYLERNHYNVRIVNLAYRMLRDPDFDPEERLRRLRAPVYGIDLHWLPHAHGAMAVAELIKRLHPDAAVLIGGLSASYFHRELAENPAVDFVLRGDSTEEPARQLLAALREGTSLEAVENLTYRAADGQVHVNPLTFVPADLDGIAVPAYDYVLRSVLKYRDLADVVPYLEWIQHPTTMVLNSRGCTLDCAICGGSRSAYAITSNRRRPAYRSPERLVEDMRTISSFSRSPIFMVHDPRIGGAPRARRLLELLADAKLPNEIVFELFFPAGDEFFELVEDSAAAWSLEITVESADEEIRRVNGKFAYPNEALESTIAKALEHGCRKLDLFFMVGIPHQTPENAFETVAFCDRLAERFGNDRRLQFYVAPLAPFLDPGSRAFEDPSLGYRVRYATLEEYRQALLEPTWADTLSFETEAMTRDDIATTTYRVAQGLNELKHERGLIDEATYRTVRDHLTAASTALDELRNAALRNGGPAPGADRGRSPITKADTTSLCGSDELRWAGAEGLRVTRTAVTHLARAFFEEVRRGLARSRGRYDTDLWQPERCPLEVEGRPMRGPVHAGRPHPADGAGAPARAIRPVLMSVLEDGAD
jgi:B12-binding domain/radical SAM domain protein